MQIFRLDDADLTRATLDGASLRGVTGARVRADGVRLVAADLTLAQLPGLRAAAADATRATLLRVDLDMPTSWVRSSSMPGSSW